MKSTRIGLSAALLLTALLTGCGGETSASSENTLVVFNYGDYIDRDTIEMFEEETGIQVEYEQYVTPEDMYTKYQAGGIAYDLICTSDYMIEKLIREGEAQTIDTDSMEYYDNLDETYLEFCRSFDPDNAYAVPYFWGTVGICYNTEMVEDEVSSWDILWDETYANQIIMENSMRDAFLVPLKLLGYSLNTVADLELREAQTLLMEQKELVMAYLVDESRDAMIAGDAALAVIYSGDATAAMESNEALDYVVPEEGSNIWFDCWMIPASCTHKEAAQKFIDFMNREDIAAMNFEYVYYGTPNAAVYESLDEETKEDYTIFPDEETLEKCEVYQYLGKEAETLYNQLWKELKAY
ncbi:MAG: ABC transporter substrate-binding protein [Lachnospiraceae bacterium]|nr:ABC transporter substrate-binding protein [Lachnospiraceae bacterium]